MAERRKKQIYGPLHFKIETEQKLLYYRRKFYSGVKDFKSFSEVGEDIAERSQNILNKKFPEDKYPKCSLKKYLAILDYLLDSESEELPSFDEKIMFLIHAIDPDLTIYFYSLRNGYSENDNTEGNNKKADDLISFIEKVVGSLDVQLLKYEEIYFRKYLKCSDIISYVNRDYSSKFFKSFKNIESFDDVSDTTFQVLSIKSAEFAKKCKDPQNINTVCFNMSNPNSFPETRYPTHKIIFFILTIDPELNALKIYEEESNVSNIKARMIEELGFYHEDLIRIEKMYRKKFMPEYYASEWAK